MRTIVLILILWPAVASALDRGSLPRECRVERLEQALAACLDHAADRLLVRMDSDIAHATSDLQAATGPELIAFDRGLRQAQAAWRAAVEDACRLSSDGARVLAALCRLEAVKLRQDRLQASLTELRTRMGADPLYPIPDAEEVEVLIPLELPPGLGGPDADVRVPLTIPITPQ